MHSAAETLPCPKNKQITKAPIFRHSKREQWGLAVIVWERDGKRGYRFEDGTERVFSANYFGLFEPAPVEGEAAERLLATLLRKPVAATKSSRQKQNKSDNVPTFGELRAIFHEVYPDGFADARWASQHRGEGTSRRAKRHRTPALAEAAKLLGKETLDSLLAEGQADEVLRRTINVLAATDLVSAKQLEPLRSANPSPRLVKALRDLLHEPDSDGAHFNKLMSLLARAPKGKLSWPLMTALRALVHPKQDVCVRPTVLFAMAKALAFDLGQQLNGMTYNNCAAMARSLHDKLVDAGEVPRDLLDVYDFIWTTCRPAAGELLVRIRQRAALPGDTMAGGCTTPAASSTSSEQAEAA